MIRPLVTLALLLVTNVTNTLAQHNHSASSQDNGIVSDSEMIDGSVHPELIPDAAAYRLYLVAISEMPNPTDEQRNRQLAYLGKIGLAKGDLQSAVTVLATFKLQYAALIAEYNAMAEADLRTGATTDIKPFLLQRDDLVQTTRDKLKAVVTPAGMTRMDAHIQNEKKQMRLSAKERQ